MDLPEDIFLDADIPGDFMEDGPYIFSVFQIRGEGKFYPFPFTNAMTLNQVFDKLQNRLGYNVTWLYRGSIVPRTNDNAMEYLGLMMGDDKIIGYLFPFRADFDRGFIDEDAVMMGGRRRNLYEDETNAPARPRRRSRSARRKKNRSRSRRRSRAAKSRR